MQSANAQQKALAGFTRMEGSEVDAWRDKATNAFIQGRMKRFGGLNLSDRVWNYTQQTKAEFELAMSQVLEKGIASGMDAETLGRKVRQYLNNPDMMYRRYHLKKVMSDGTKKDVVEWRRRVIDKDGKMHFVKEDLANVGTGVYRSARQNALRLTITETNMAYNYANCKRWSEEPFVLGIRIRLSGNHPEEDICDELQGDYPADFDFPGWHPRCRCTMSSILIDRNSEEWKHLRSLPADEYAKYQSPNRIKEYPDAFKRWCEDNKKKLTKAREEKKLPYFVRNNEKAVGEIVGWDKESRRDKILDAAKLRHQARSNELIKDIQNRWANNRTISRLYNTIITQRERNNTNDIKCSIGKGEVCVSKFVKVTDSDFYKLVQVAAFFAAEGQKVVLTPKMTRPPMFDYREYYASLIGTKFESKCPDILVIDKKSGKNIWYEHEGFTTNNPKNAFRNMMNDGLKQSNRLIIDKPNLTEAFMKRLINQRIRAGQDIKEVWIRNNGNISLLYKKLEE